MSVEAPGWPRTDRLLSICVIGWAKLSMQQREGSGYNLSASELASGLVLSGHKVCYLRSGMDYTLLGGMRIEHVETWRGVECHSVFNSPNLAISRYNFKNQAREMSSPAQTRMIMQWMDSRKVELVHVHSLEGMGLDLLPAIKASGRKLVVTLHNHWYVCPQVDLLRNESCVCMDYEGGSACEHCIEALPPQEEIRRRKLQTVAWETLGPNSAKFAREARSALGQLKKRMLSDRVIETTPRQVNTASLCEDPATAPPLAAPGECSRGIGRAVVGQVRDANEAILSKSHHLAVVNEYGTRRHAGLAALAHADRVIGPSRFITDVLVSMGFAKQKCVFVPYGQPHFDALRRVARGHVFYEKRPWTATSPDRPLRIGFLGTVFPNKGLEVLTQAIPQLTQRARQQCHFVIRAHGDDTPFRHRLAPYPEVSFLGGYRYEELASIHRDFDVAIVPHIWLENAPLVMLELLNSGKFMIMSRLGGVVDFIREPDGAQCGNGIFFNGGDAADLAKAITRVVMGEVEIPSAKEVQAASPNLISYVEHVRRVEELYREVSA